MLHESYEYVVPRPNIILQFHHDLYSCSQGTADGSYKDSDNVIAEIDAARNQKAGFIPVSAFQTADAMEELCSRFLKAYNEFENRAEYLKNRSLSKPDRKKAAI